MTIYDRVDALLTADDWMLSYTNIGSVRCEGG
jgi:hypothetical protein